MRAIHLILIPIFLLVSEYSANGEVRREPQEREVDSTATQPLPEKFFERIAIQNTKSEANLVDETRTGDQASANSLHDEKIDQTIKAMSLRSKIGQLFMIGFMGDDLSRGLDRSLSLIQPGGIIVFGRNIKSARQVALLNLKAQKASLKSAKLPLFIAVDQEGGDVLRIKTKYPLPSALALGETRNGSLVERAGRSTGSLLRTLGFNMNLAPVLDIADPTKRSFIGTRTFGSEPQAVSQMSERFAVGLQKADILPTAKHFPGHGSIADDSHLKTPERDLSLSNMRTHDLMPFAILQKNLRDPWAIMLAHVSYPELDPTNIPATFSYPIVTELLRKKMGFQGLILTDDIEMAGAAAIPNASERAIRAIQSGVDMIMVAWNKRLQWELVQALLSAVKRGDITEDRINLSLQRILLAKQRFAHRQFKFPTQTELIHAVRDPEMKVIAEETMLAKLKTPLTKAELEFLEYSKERELFIFSANRQFFTSFQSALPKRKVRFFLIGKNQPFRIDRVMRSNPNAVGIYYLSGPFSAGLASQLNSDIANRTLLVTVEAEGTLRNYHEFKQIADVYYRHPDLGKLIAQHYFISPPSADTLQSQEKRQDEKTDTPPTALRTPSSSTDPSIRE